MLDLSSLNQPQREAVEAIRGPLLVLAGAGSGKTRVIIFRIAWLMELGVPAERILAVSFTNKAAAEMRARVRALVGPAAGGVRLSTFHALGARFLREEASACGISERFTILDEGDQIDATRRALAQCGYDPERFDPKAVHARIGHYKCRMSQPEGAGLEAVVARVLPLYQRRLRVMNGVDFDDLIALPVHLMETREEVRDRWRGRFEYVLVDEYQDTNIAQLRWLKALCGPTAPNEPTGNLCVVGDDDQSIYMWRGAVAGNILRFGDHFPGARTIVLDQNYRSTNAILGCANALIGNNEDRHVKRLWSDLGEGTPVRHRCLETADDEAHAIASDLLRQRHQLRLPWRCFGVLYRTNAQSRVLEDAIRGAGIPYRIVGGTRFYDRKEVRDVVAYLRVIANPMDEAALRRILNYPARGIGDVTVERLGEHARALGRPFAVALREAARSGVPPRTQAAIEAFHDLLQALRRDFDAEPNLGAAYRAMLSQVGIQNEIVRTTRDPRVMRRRMENVEEVACALAGFQPPRHGVDPPLVAFLAQLSLDGRQIEAAAPDQDEVSLMTLHSAKGLEFEGVYLPGWEEGLLPHQRVIDGEGSVAEERRLAYVGLTRARRRLMVTRARTRLRYGKLQRRRPSRFLHEIPAELLEGGHQGQPPERETQEVEREACQLFDELDAFFD